MVSKGTSPDPKPSAKYAWMDGQFIPWSDAKVHVNTPAVSQGATPYEGIRGYWNEEKNQMYVFKLMDHLDRLFESMKILRITIPYSKKDLAGALLELIRRNESREDTNCSPAAYLGVGDRFSVDPAKVHMGAWITAWPLPQLPHIQTGIRACISSWERISDHVQPPRVKAYANYIVFRLATVQAKLDNYDEPLLLNHEGKVSEAPGSCLFMVRKGVAITPPVTSNILESITRDTLIRLLRDELGVQAVERDIDRTELYIADEVLLCGTGREICPVISVDRHPVGEGRPGPLTRRIQGLYFDIVRGKVPKFSQWLTPVYAPGP